MRCASVELIASDAKYAHGELLGVPPRKPSRSARRRCRGCRTEMKAASMCIEVVPYTGHHVRAKGVFVRPSARPEISNLGLTASIHIDAAFIFGPTSATTSARGPRRLSRRDSEQLAVGVFRVGRDQLNRGAPHPAHGQQLCPLKRCVATSASAVATIARSMGSRRRETPAVNLKSPTPGELHTCRG